MSLQNRRLYEFGSFRLEPAERRLLRDGEEVPLPPKAFDLLVVLVSRAGHLVSKEDLLKEVWPGTFVEEASLSYTVSVLRKALQTEAPQVRYIDTVQRLGYRFTHDVRTVIADALEGKTGTASPESPPPEQKPPTSSLPAVVERSRHWVGGKLLWRAAVAGALLVLGLAALVQFRHAREARPPLRRLQFVETVPGHIILTDWDHPVISPDGHRVAFTGLSEGRRQLWVRPLESVPILLPGTDGATMPFWSPDSKSVAFFADRKLKKIDVERGEAITLCCDSFPIGQIFGAWGSSGVILFSKGLIYSVAETGGAPRPVTQLDASRRELRHNVVGFLSDSRRFVFFSDPPPLTHYVTSLDDPNQRRTLTIGTGGRIDGLSVVRDHLLYAREGVVVAQPFNEQTLEARSPPLTLARTEPAPWQPRPSASRTGVVVFRSSWYTMRQLAWRRRDGDSSTVIGSPDVYTAVELSPSGTRAVVVKGGSGWVQDRDLWLVDLTSGLPSRLTTHPALESSPAWSPDGRRIAYHSSQAGVISPFVKNLDTGEEVRLLEPTQSVALDDWTADGRLLVLRTYGSAAFAVPLTGVGKLERLVDTPYGEDQLQVSPDGRWIAFNSEESKAYEVYVARFPTFADKQRVSVAGGVQPKWRGDGRELFYLAPDGTMMVVQSTLESTGKFAPARPLFKTSLSPASHQISEFDVTSDGQSFLLLEPASTRPQTFTFILNWTETVEK